MRLASKKFGASFFLKGDSMDEIKRYYENNKKKVWIAGACVATGFALIIFGKKCYAAGFVAGMMSIISKNEGKVINF